jgi:ABC-type multidrug transport system fused ATPase/permease subunit
MPNLTSLPTSNTASAQLFYDGVEQFFCTADSCTQSVTDTDPSTWECQNLMCTCIPNTTFCGAVPSKNLTSTLNQLNGALTITCSSNTTCSFGQTLLNSLFGASGLTLSPCSFGECVRQSVIDGTSNTTTSSSTKQHSDLSGGVIAGLAVVCGLIGLALLLFLVGWLSQRKARRIASNSLTKRGGYSLEWNDISYIIPTGSVGFRPFWGAAKGGRINNDDKVILDNVSGRVDPGEMMAILGPSGKYLRPRTIGLLTSEHPAT